MLKIISIVFLMAAAFCLPSSAQAQRSTKAYAPENLRQLSYSERIRVIEREYSDQSNGRNIPDDQLEFYLDSIDSGWTFNRIKQDISTSLGNYNNGGGNWNPGNDWTPRNVICSSNKNQYAECRTPFRGRAIVAQQISDKRCVEGVNWGQRQDIIWVNNGCRATFTQANNGNNNGWNNNNGNEWNGNGWGNNNYQVACTSDGNDFKSCYWDHRYGSPVLIKKISKKSCIAGRSWGYDNRGLWVNNGCRAIFGAR